MPRITRDCFICGSPGRIAYEARVDPQRMSAYTYASRKVPELMHYEYSQCDACGVLFATDLPDRATLLSAYEDAAFDASTESRFAARAYVNALDPLLRSGVTSVLDVGCGDGEFLLACRARGIPVLQGIEPSPAATENAREGIDQVIHHGGYEDHTTETRFDLVTLFQTIEHIDDPVGFFIASRRFLNPGGYVAVACHDYRAPVNRLLGERSPIFDIEHLQLFSKSSIRYAMEKAGLTVLSVKTYANTYPLAYWARLAPLPKAIKSSRPLRGGMLGTVPLRLPLGNVMAIARTQ